MNTNVETPLFRRIAQPLAAAPVGLVAYAVFASGVTFADYLLLPFTPAAFRATLVPYTGWVAAMFYAYTLYFAFALIYQARRRSGTRFAITVLLLLQVVFGAYEISQMSGENYGNPYLTISPWRWVWAILIPCLWMVVLHLPRVNRFCRQTHEPQRP